MRVVCAAALGLAICGNAWAQQPSSVVYEPDFFAQFSPRTALDMVARVPGFTLDEGEERRGFAGAQGNVLIDGEPPTSKAQEVDDILARISASDVVRVELMRGAGSSASSAQGVWVNVVRRLGRGEGVWELSAERVEDGRVSPNGEAAWSGRRGELEYGLSASFAISRFSVHGVRADLDDEGGLDETRVERVPADEREASLSGEGSFALAGGALALNAQLSRWERDEREQSAMFDSVGAFEGSIAGVLEERENVGEIGGSWRRDLGVWRVELGGVATRRSYESAEDTAEFDDVGALDEAATQTQRIDSGETILRGALRRALNEDWRLELGAEAALNTLEQRLALTADDGGGPVPVALPSANVRVEEERAEASFMLAGRFAPNWNLEAGASVEISRLTQSGDTNQDAELTYWKPSLQATRTLGERNQVRLRFYRDVGQLDFEDFVSAADITSSVVNAGNPDLRPETSWRFEATGDWRFDEDGAFGVTLYHWAIEDVLDIVPIGTPGNFFDAPGNIGDATAYGVRVTLSFPLPLGAELRLDGTLQTSEASDPLTGGKRSISEFDESMLTIGFRQDIASFAWGVDYERETEAASYRLDQIERERDAEDLSVWIETTAFGGVKLRAWGENLTDSAERRDRRAFDPDRLGAFDGSDHRARREGPTFGLSASGSF